MDYFENANNFVKFFDVRRILLAMQLLINFNLGNDHWATQLAIMFENGAGRFKIGKNSSRQKSSFLSDRSRECA